MISSPPAAGCIIFVAGLLAGCVPGEPDGGGPTGALDGEDVRMATVTEDIFTVGGWEADGWDSFSRVSDLHFDRSGNLLILDGQNRLVVVGSDGAFLRQISRPGDGPGEFRRVGAVAAYRGGRIVARDFGQRAFLVFEEDGRFVESFPDLSGTSRSSTVSTSEGNFVTSGGIISDFLHALPDGRVLVEGESASSPEQSVRALDVYEPGREQEIFYLAWDLPPAAASTSLPPAGSVQASIVRAQSGTRAFSPRLHADVLSDGRIALVDSIGYRVKLLTPAGTVQRTLERSVSPVPVTEEIREAERRRMAATMQVMVRGGGPRATSPQVAEQLRQSLLAQVTFAEEIPVISGLAVDSEDRIWVQRWGSDGISVGDTDILTADGSYVGTLSAEELRLPRAFGPSGLMAYVESDEMEVPVVRVVRLLAFDR